MNLTLILIIVSIALFCIAVILLWLYFSVSYGNRNIFRSLNMRLFLITVPKEAAKDDVPQKDERELIGTMEQLYASFSSILKIGRLKKLLYGDLTIAFELAVPHIGEEIHFYMAVPRILETTIEKQIQGFFPNAEVERVPDYNIFTPSGAYAASILRLQRPYYLPIKTYKEVESDPINALTNALSKIEKEGEGAAVQIIIKGLSDKWGEKPHKIVNLLKKGKSHKQARQTVDVGVVSLISEVFSLFMSSSVNKDEQKQEEPKQIDEDLVKAIHEKIGKKGFAVNARLIASARTQERADEILSNLEGAIAQYDNPAFNGINAIKSEDKLLKKGASLKKTIYNFSFRIFNPREQMILNTEELTSIFHFPIVTTQTPKIKWLKAKTAAAPANLPEQGLVLGRNIYRGMETIVRMADEDRRRHLYVIGQTGTGKTTFLEGLIRQDIESGKGVSFIDPHGDTAERILGYVPESRAEDVIYFNPSDIDMPLGLNMLEYDPAHPEQKTFIVNELINIFDKLYDLRQTGGPMFEQYMRNALLLVMDDPGSGATLMEVPKVLSDKDYRHLKLSKTKNIVVKDFWEKEAEKAGGEAALANMVPYITSKMNIFIANDIMRPIIGQAKSAFNFRKVMDENKILLINLSKGRLGDINSYLLGMIIVGKLLMAALSRVDIPEDQRSDFYLYLDEFQNVTTKSIATILSEARKYRLNLIIAHQFIGQLDEEIQKAVFGNVGSMLSFRIGVEDAEFMENQFKPVFTRQDLINIDNFNAYLKLLVNNKTSNAFSIRCYPRQLGNIEIAEKIKEFSRLKYGKPRDEIEEDIAIRTRVEFSESPSIMDPENIK